MSKKDDFEAKGRDEEETDDRDDADRDSDSEIESDPAPAPAAKPATTRGKASAKGAAKASAKPTAKPGIPSTSVGMFVALALAAGGAGGWFGHIAQAKAALRSESVAPVGSSGVASGPCGAWQKKICNDGGGERSSACMQARGAAELLTPSTCEAALISAPATLTRLKAARASCDKLVSKLCGDLQPGSKTCDMIKERTPSFPPQRCDEMMNHYDEVLGQLKQIDQAGMQMGGPGMSPH
jgi:hypothetical protein